MTPKSTHTAYQCVTGCGGIHIHIPDNLKTGKFKVQLGKMGTCASAQTDAFSRILTMSFKLGADPHDVAKHLRGIACQHPSPTVSGQPIVLSCSDAIAQTLLTHFKEKEA